MARQIKHAELEGYQASGENGVVAFCNVDLDSAITLDAHKIPQVIAILKVAARDALKADSKAEYVVKARAPRSPNKTASKK